MEPIAYITPITQDLSESEVSRLQVPAWKVACPNCSAANTIPVRTPLYLENVHPYRQTCHVCGTEVCKGQSPVWPELFTK